jgi:glutamate 5-kinase
MKIVIKVGTQSILSSNGTPFELTIAHLVEQVIILKKMGHQLILVSSGAVASGRKAAWDLIGKQYGSSIAEKQVLASLGQHELIYLYASLFKKHQVLASQILLSKHDFQTRKNYLNIARLLRELLDEKEIIPIINENDSVSIEELMFTDNDELAGLIAAQINADKLIILTNVEGVYSDHPDAPGSELITLINPKSGWPKVSSEKSALGRGGMMSKLETARKISSLGITTHIAHINHPFVIKRIVEQESLGTTILPAQKKSNIKKWIAYHNEKKEGSITINLRLFNILKENNHIVSILPIGIERYTGDFKRGALIDILSPDGIKIAVGLAKYDSSKLAEYLGNKNKPIFIHYDHLHVFQEVIQ